MRHPFFTLGSPTFLAAAAWLALTAPLWADSNIIASSAGYQATDRLTSISPNGYNVFGNLAAVYADGHLKLYNRSTWLPVDDLGDANYGGKTATFNSFVKFDPNGQSLWVGYTVGGNVDDRIYQVTNLDATPNWNCVATLPSNYDLAFSGTTPYVSGLNSTVWGGPNAIWRLDTSGSNQSTKIADVGGFAAGIAFDAAGNLYYGTSFGADDKLVEFTAQQVTEGGKTFSDATVLSNLPYSATSVSVDGAGHVLFTVNHAEFVDGSYSQLASTLGIWNGTAGSSDNYSIVGAAGADHWYTFVRTSGNVTAGGKAYLSDGGALGSPVLGLAEIHHLLPGDANGDGRVDVNDLTIVLTNYNMIGTTWANGDYDGDGQVNINDLTVVLTDYNATAGSARMAAVPEPAGAVLLAAAALMGACGFASRRNRRRRSQGWMVNFR